MSLGHLTVGVFPALELLSGAPVSVPFGALSYFLISLGAVDVGAEPAGPVGVVGAAPVSAAFEAGAGLVGAEPVDVVDAALVSAAFEAGAGLVGAEPVGVVGVAPVSAAFGAGFAGFGLGPVWIHDGLAGLADVPDLPQERAELV